uniref:VAB-10A protein n=1 Tax=Caenorhabditis elegans TaxID=6239 RepID=Q86NF9_CAEEL|nr:VAB-10A protein [Caenorhabditis elegans]
MVGERYRSHHAVDPSDAQEKEVLDHYELNREKYNDERDNVQKKTFTKWVNKHLSKTDHKIDDLFVDLRDGYALIALLEALTGERIQKENGYTRFHRIQNVQYCLDFLKKKNIKLVNIRPEDIVEGNGKLTLGLIWTIILNFQVSVIRQRLLLESSQHEQMSAKHTTTNSQVSLHGSDATSARDALLQWARRVTAGYPRVNVNNFSSSWRDGLAFNAILHRYRSSAIDWNKISSDSVSNTERLNNAFAAADREFGVERLLDAEDVDTNNPDEKSIITYVSSLYNALPHEPEMSRLQKVQEEYIEEAYEWREWVVRAIQLVDDRHLQGTASELIYELQRFREDDLPPREEQKRRLTLVYEHLEKVMRSTELFAIPHELSAPELQRVWNELQNSIDRRFDVLERHRIQEGNSNDLLSRLARGIGITNEKLDLILKRIEDVEARVDTSPPAAVERTVSEIVDDLNALESPIARFFEDVEELKSMQHPEANDFYKQVYGLHQRRTTYLDRLTNQILVRLGVRTDSLHKENQQRLENMRKTSFSRVEECIEWVRVRMEKLTTMEFLEDLETLEHVFEQHKFDNRDIQDFRQNVDECIARQAEVSAEDTYEYCELLRVLESEYQQLRDLSAGRMLDLDSLIAFVRAAQLELIWVSERESIEVTRNWSDIKQLDLPMLTNYYKQLLHEMELREKQYNDVHNQGAALLNQGHPAIRVIEVYLRQMQSQWDWLLALSKCLEEHLRDALNLKSFMEEASDAEAWIQEQSVRLENNYNRTDFSLEEGERFLRELDEIKEILNKYHQVLMALTERCASISPLWQRGERIPHPIKVTALCDYSDENVTIKAGDDVYLLDNSDLIKWTIRDISGAEGQVPSVVFRIPPTDARLTALLNRLLQQFEKLKKLWDKKHRMVRFNMVLNTMRTIQGWDLDTFNSIDPDQRDAIMKALNDDANKLLSELDPNDPLALRLREELRRTNEHFWNLLNASQKPPEPDWASQYDQKMAELLKKLEEAWRELNDAVGKPISRSPEDLERVIHAHKRFEDALQALDSDVANVKELFRQLPNPTPTQRVNHDRLNGLWDDLWDLSRMYVERIKVLESVLNGMVEVADIVRQHEITLNSFDDLPAALDKLRGHHSQLLEINMVLKVSKLGAQNEHFSQQQTVIDQLNRNVALLRQHVSRTRINEGHHPDVDAIEDEVQKLNVRWENVNSQIASRLLAVESALQIQMVYRSEYETEMSWLDTVEETINRLRKPEELRPEQYQQQLDMLIAEYTNLQEHTQAIEHVNKEGGRFIHEAKIFDAKLGQYSDGIVGIHGPGIKSEFRRTKPQPKNGSQIVTEELELLNRRFAQLSSLILERRNTMQVLIQNWKRQKQEEEDRRRAEEEEKRRAFEAARLKALEDAERLRREREDAEARRRAKDDADRARRMAEDAERARREAEEAERRRREEEERRRREAEDRKRRQDEEDRRRREEEERRRREEEEKRRKKPDFDLKIQKPTMNIEPVVTSAGDEWEIVDPIGDRAKISEVEDEMQTFAEETITNTQFYEMEGNLNKKTGEVLTFIEAIRQENLTAAGQFFDIPSASVMSLEEAAKYGLVEQDLPTVLNTTWGIHHPETRQPITLSEAIRIGLYDSNIRQFRDIHTGEILSQSDLMSKGIANWETVLKLIKEKIMKLPPTSLANALEKRMVDPQTGVFKGRTTDMELQLWAAIYHGYLSIENPEHVTTIGTSLTDAIENGFINANNAEFNDRNSNDSFKLRDAVSKRTGLINNDVVEIVQMTDDEKKRVPLGAALVRNVIGVKDGKYTNLASRQSMSLKEAHQDGLIGKALTLEEAAQNKLVDSSGYFVDRGILGQRYTLLEAIVAGLIDAEVRHIVDPNENDVISISEAMERGLLLPNGKIVLEKDEKEFTIPEAVHEGLLTKRVRHSIFNIRGIRNTETSQNLSFNEAVEAGVIIPNAERVVDLQTQESFLITDDRAKNLIEVALHELLTTPVGIKNDRGAYELNLVRAVSSGIIDPVKGVFFNKNTKHELSTKEAYEQGFITLRGALKVFGLLNVPPALVTPAKKLDRTRRIGRPGQEGGADGNHVTVTLQDAMRQGLVGNQRYVHGKVDLSLEEALNRGLLDPNSQWIMPDQSKGDGPTIEEKTTETMTETGQQLAPKYFPDKNIEESVTTVKRVRTTETTALGGPGGVSVYRSIAGGKGALEVPSRGYHIYEAERKGLIDLTNGKISAPNVDRVLSFAEGIELGIIDATTIQVSTGGRSVSVKEALEKKIMESDGSVNGRNIEQAVEAKTIVIDAEPLVPYNNQSKNIIQIPSGNGPIISFRQVGQPVVEESTQSWEFDTQQGVFVDNLTGEKLSLERALATGKVAPEDISVRDGLTGREMPLEEAEKWGIIDSKNRYYFDKSQNKRMSYTEAAQQHLMYLTGGVPENASDAVHTTVKVQTRTAVAKKEALSSGLPLSDYSLGKALSLGWYDQSAGTFTHPETQKQLTLKEAIMKGLFDPYDTTIVDKKAGKEISLLEAIREEIVDDNAGTVKDTQTGRVHNFLEAGNLGLVKGKNFGDTLDSSLFSGRLDLGSGSYTRPSGGSSMPIHEAINRNYVDRSSVSVRDPSSGQQYSYQEAVDRRIVDADRGLIHGGGDSTSFSQGLTSGHLVSSGSSRPTSGNQSRLVEQRLQLTPFAPNGGAGRSRDGRHELVDLGGGQQVQVKVVRGEGGVEKGEYTDPKSGMKFTIQMHGDPVVTETKTSVKSTSQVHSVELEPHAEFVGIDRVRDKRNNHVYSLEEARRLGLAKVDKKGKQMTRSYQAFRSNIDNAVNNGVVDSHNQKISLENAIHARIIDIRNLSYHHPTHGSVDLKTAASQGLVDVTLSEVLPKGIIHPGTGERIDIKRGIELRIIDAATGKVRDPRDNKTITWIDILKPVYQAIASEGVFDPTKGHHVPVTTALNDGLINASTGNYRNSITGEDVPLSDTVDRGLIDRSTYETITKPFFTDYRSNRKLNLVEAVRERLIDPKNRTIQLSRQSIVPIAKAVQDGRIPMEIGEKLRKVDKLNFAEALGKGLIDSKQNVFTDPDTGRQMSIAQAIQEGFIDTGSVQGIEGNDESNLFNVLQSSDFDETSGRIYDKKSSLHLTFNDAVRRGVIDGDSLLHLQATGDLLTLRDALHQNKIDSNGKFVEGANRLKISDAVKSGRLTVIASPSEAVQAVTEGVKRRDAEGYKFRISEYDDSQAQRQSVPKFRETVTVSKLTPQYNEPGLSVRMRQSTTSIGDRASKFLEDPSQLAEIQQDFLSSLEAAQFDTDEKVIEHPHTRQRVSVREAAETGLLDVQTGEIVNPDNGRRFSIPRAVHMKLVGGDAAKRIMEQLNMPVEEVAYATQTITSSTHRAPSPVFATASVSQPSGGATTTREFTRTINWHGQPSELRNSQTDPLAAYTTVSSNVTESTEDAPAWARKQ